MSILKCKSKLAFWLSACVIMAAAFLLVCCFGQASVANAQNTAQFVIILDGGDLWILKYKDNEISRFEGDFFVPEGQNAASVVFKEAMDAVLAREGIDEYTIEFLLPSIGYTQSGSGIFDYTENANGGIVLKGVYEPSISANITEALEYKTDGDFVRYAYATRKDGGLSFGQGVDVGNYQVRFVIYEIFTYLDRVYEVPRFSQSASCTVQKAVPAAPQVQPVSVQYGVRAEDIALLIPAENGTWTLSDEQDEEGVERDTLLSVKESGYVLKFDYTPQNQNYQTLVGLEVRVFVTPRPITINIGNAFSFVGESPVTDFAYEIITPLVGGDTENDLGINFEIEGLDINVAGQYIVTARFENGNYVARSANMTSSVLNGGRYTVYATRVLVTAPDGVEFEVLLNEGYRNVSLRIEMAVITDIGRDMQSVEAYAFIFENRYGARVYPDGGFTVTWQEGALGEVKSVVAVLNDGSYVEIAVEGNNCVTVPQGTDGLAFMLQNLQPEDEKFGPMYAACVAMSVLTGLTGVTFIVLVAVYIAKRRYFK